MTRTLILMFHPAPARSRANAALARAAATLPDTEVIDMTALYPEGRIDMMTDGAVEAARLTEADRIVLEFPIQWYATPTILQDWKDAVLTRMFYVLPQEGAALAGKSLSVAVTAGNTPEAYTFGGRNLFPMAALLAPLMATAHRCGLIWQPPFILYEADKLPDDALAEAGQLYRDYLTAPVQDGLIAAAA